MNSDTKGEDADDPERIWEINEFDCTKKDTSGKHIDADLIKLIGKQFVSFLLFVSFLRLKNIFDKYHRDLKKDLKDTFFHTDDDDDENSDDQKAEIDNAVVQVMFCLQPAIRFNITGFNLDSDSNLSETIFRSICQCKFANFQIFYFNSIKISFFSASKIIETKRKRRANSCN